MVIHTHVWLIGEFLDSMDARHPPLNTWLPWEILLQNFRGRNFGKFGELQEIRQNFLVQNFSS